MGRYYGRIGFAVTEEIRDEEKPGTWVDRIVERNYYGDISRKMWRYTTGDSVNDNVQVSNVVSILADPFALEHFHKMSYIEWYGSLWKVESVEVQYPRLNLTLGGVYNGETPESPRRVCEDHSLGECVFSTT